MSQATHEASTNAQYTVYNSGLQTSEAYAGFNIRGSGGYIHKDAIAEIYNFSHLHSLGAYANAYLFFILNRN